MRGVHELINDMETQTTRSDFGQVSGANSGFVDGGSEIGESEDKLICALYDVEHNIAGLVFTVGVLNNVHTGFVNGEHYLVDHF
jgi:hypothetical protein